MEENIAKIKLNLLDTKIKNYKYLIIGLENNECEIVKSPRNISEILHHMNIIKVKKIL